MSSRRHAERLTMGSGAVLSVQEAAELLPIADAVARTWLRDRGLIRHLAGKAVIVWADVLDALRESEANVVPTYTRRRRVKL